MMTSDNTTCALSAKTCVPCKGGVPALNSEQIAPLLGQLNDWQVIEQHHLTKGYTFSDFVSALAFVNSIGDLAESQGHHPDIGLAWGKVEVTIWTHKIDGLTESDFIFAAKIDELPRP